ncbi:CoB--CoM heterodisulfide reductase iron-sulfur subunit B family protein [Candidatus Bathyarchaeota archaeon]|nr:CoB--CoM heterodisulfide reductase iron-sulfur subunit B family protein [Candidatus Bathyarchaeota archaeon]
MKYSLFLGCTIPARQVNYERSVRKVCEALGVELVDADYGCCGFPIEPVDETKALAMAAVNLMKAAETGLPVVTMCSACGEMLVKAEKLLGDEGVVKDVNKVLQKSLGMSYGGQKPPVHHFARMLYETYGLDKISEQVVKPLKGLRIATHPGCHYVRPKELYGEFDDPEFPVSLDRLVEATGAEAVDYVGKTDCCGGGILAVSERTSKAMTGKKLETLKPLGLDALVLICPFCGIMFDKYQRTLEEELETSYGLPVLYYSQLLGLALGIDPDELGFDVNAAPAGGLLEKVSKL